MTENMGRASSRVSTGISGLDQVLYGGLLPQRACVVRGGAGTGKTTLGAHFLATGAARGERSLFISFGESEAQVRANATSVGIDLGEVEFLDLSPDKEFFAQVEAYDLFSPADVEREPTTRRIVERVEAVKPQRVFVDAMTQLRYLAPDQFQFHKQALSFLRFLVLQGATVLISSEASDQAPDEDLQFLSDGIIHLDLTSSGRRLYVSKLRGSDFRPGYHSVLLTKEGFKVIPKLVPREHRREFKIDPLPSGVPVLDEMLRGGLERGTITILTGPTGVGKSTLGAQFMKEAAGRGERCVLYTFEEEVNMLLARCESVSIPLREMISTGALSVVKVEPLQYGADEFAQMVRQEVEEHDARVIMIDSLEGYQLSLAGEDLVSHLHALCKYLQNVGVTTLVINEKSKITGGFTATEAGISYLADNILYLRYMERHRDGVVELRKVVGVLKKRLSSFDPTLREIRLSAEGIDVDAPLEGLSAMLSETPSQEGW